MVFHGSRLVFHGFRPVFIAFHGSRLVFHGSRSVLMVFHGSWLVFLVPGCFIIFSWFEVGFLLFQVGFHGFS